jgi:hypothetical protein
MFMPQQRIKLMTKITSIYTFNFVTGKISDDQQSLSEGLTQRLLLKQNRFSIWLSGNTNARSYIYIIFIFVNKKQSTVQQLNTKTPHTAQTERRSARNVAKEPLHTDKKCITKLNTQTSTTPSLGNMYNFKMLYFYK